MAKGAFDIKEPRTWIVAMGAIGAAFLVYVTLAASFSGGSPVADYALGEVATFEKTPPPGRRAPREVIEGPDGPVSLQDFAGKVVLVNVWATWCAPCVRELPSLAALAADMPEERFAFVPVSLDTNAEKAAAFLQRNGIDGLPVLIDRNFRLARAMGAADTLPTTILYDAEGREIGRLVGDADWTSPEALRLVRAALVGDLKA